MDLTLIASIALNSLSLPITFVLKKSFLVDTSPGHQRLFRYFILILFSSLEVIHS